MVRQIKRNGDTKERNMKNLLTVAEILDVTGIARATLYRMIDEGLPYKQVGNRKKLFDPEEVKEFIG